MSREELNQPPLASPEDDRQTAFDFFGRNVPARHLVRASTPADRKPIAETIGRAFFDDPVAVYLFPDEGLRRAGFGSFAKLAMDQFRESGAVFVTEPVRGAAIWQCPSPAGLSLWRQIALALRLFLVARGSYQRAISLSVTMEKYRLSEPHWYLAILGTDPDFQGRGHASALLAPTLGRCDREGAPAYLESSKHQNLPFYQRHGFEVSGEIQIPNGPVIWPMIRRPA